VTSLLRDPEERLRLGAAARNLVQEQYSWSKVADTFARTLQDVISRRTPGDVRG
jgi:glycosyltransferase involved in cell wall biosynthesis